MGIYNRDYYRSSRSGGSWGIDGLTPVVKYLLIANVVVFLLQILVVREVRQTPLEMMREYNPALDKLLTEAEAEGPEAMEKLKKEYPGLEKLTSEKSEKKLSDLLFAPTKRVSVVQEWAELDTNKVVYGGQIWRLLTHAFCHDRYGIFHILFNMLFLYWFGCTLESMVGSREFLLFYLAAIVIAALALVGLDLYLGTSVPAIGASGAVMAVMMLYTMYFPRQVIYICWVIPVEMRWVMAFYLIWDLHPVLLALSGDHHMTGIAHAAHLGGLGFGFLYAKYNWRLQPIYDQVERLFARFKSRSRPRLRLVENSYPEVEEDVDTIRMDAVLQKIQDSGQASLTEEDLELLKLMSDRIKNRRKEN
jgi:membrane associated rhomboid family serine protease